MSLLSLAAVACVGTVFWLVSPEAAVALAGVQHRWSPLTIGLVTAAGQAVALAGLFFFGSELRRHWRWFDRKCEQARTGTRLGTDRYSVGMVVAASVFGVPPVSVTAALLPGVAPRPKRLLPLMLVLRFLRFTAMAWAAALCGWHLPWQ